jgi:hypothetical protein
MRRTGKFCRFGHKVFNVLFVQLYPTFCACSSVSFHIFGRGAARYSFAPMTAYSPKAPPRGAMLHELAYVSTLAPGLPVSTVAEIARQSRAYNRAHGITGLLIFDGIRFCQQLEGEPKKLLKLVERISCDSRHVNVQIFHHAPLALRRFINFSLAFAHADKVDLSDLEALDGTDALQALLAMLPSLDLGI